MNDSNQTEYSKLLRCFISSFLFSLVNNFFLVDSADDGKPSVLRSGSSDGRYRDDIGKGMIELMGDSLFETVFKLNADAVFREIIGALIERDGVDNFGHEDPKSLLIRSIQFAVSVDGGKLSEHKGHFYFKFFYRTNIMYIIINFYCCLLRNASDGLAYCWR